MKEETARALTLAACALQAYALAKSFKREVIDPYREPPKENDAQGLEIMNQDAIKGYPLNSPGQNERTLRRGRPGCAGRAAQAGRRAAAAE